MKFMRTIRAATATAGLLAALGLAASANAASNVYYSVDAAVAPGVNIGVTNAPPVYAPPAVYVQPQPVYVQPPPVVVQPRPVYVVPQPVYYGAAPVYVQPDWRRERWERERRAREHAHEHREHGDRDRGERGGHGHRDHDD